MYQVRILQTNVCFFVNGNERILQAALRQGIALPFGCGNGICGVCIAQVVSGKVVYPKPPLALFEEDAKQGKCLYCVGLPRSDIVLDVPEFSS